MLRKDTLYMMISDWEPKVPDKETIEKQLNLMRHKQSGSVRLFLGKVAGDPGDKD